MINSTHRYENLLVIPNDKKYVGNYLLETINNLNLSIIINEFFLLVKFVGNYRQKFSLVITEKKLSINMILSSSSFFFVVIAIVATIIVTCPLSPSPPLSPLLSLLSLSLSPFVFLLPVLFFLFLVLLFFFFFLFLTHLHLIISNISSKLLRKLVLISSIDLLKELSI